MGVKSGKVLNPDTPIPPYSETVVLGVDPGLATTGWGVIAKTNGQLSLRSYGVILSPAATALPDRLKRIRRELILIIESHKPSLMAIEELYFAKFAVSIAATAQARGVILLTAAEYGLDIVEYNPRAVKMAMTGFGSASKIQMQSMLQRHFRLKELPRPDDAADALAIALCHVQTRHEFKVVSTRKSRAVFEAALEARALRPLSRQAVSRPGHPSGGGAARTACDCELSGRDPSRLPTALMDPPLTTAGDDKITGRIP